MSNSFEAKHPREQAGRFTNADSTRSDAGQVVGRPTPKPGPPTFVQTKKTQFVVRQEVDPDIAQRLMERSEATVHASRDRSGRLAVSNPGRVYRAFVVDRGNGRDGLEAHVVTENAEVHIFSVRNGRLITMLFARPSQVTRYFGNERVPKSIMDKARDNVATMAYDR